MTTEASVQYQDPIRQYLRLYIKDDDDALEHVLITCFSARTNNPLNLAVMAPSSVGKSYVISLVSSLFPNAHVFTGGSPKSFFYEQGKLVDAETHEDLQGRVDELTAAIDRDPENSAARAERRELLKRAMTRVSLEGRVLVFLEPPDQGLFESLKDILSHDKWESEYRTVEKGSDGRLSTHRILLVGWPAFVFASAKDQDKWALWPEIQSRCVMVSPNLNEEKFQHANALTADLLGLPSFVLKRLFPEDLEVAAREEVERIAQAVDRLGVLGEREGGGSRRDNFVLDPFAQRLAELFPHESGLRARQFRSLLTYANLLALINGERRAQLVIRGQTRAIVASREDVARAAALVFSSTWSHIPAHKLAFYEGVVLKLYEAGSSLDGKGRKVYVPMKTQEVLEFARKRGWKLGPKRLRETYLEPLEESGLLSSAADPDDRRSLLWTPSETSQKYTKLGDSHNFAPDSVIAALKRVQSELAVEQGIYTQPDGKTAWNLEELALWLIGPPTPSPAEEVPVVAYERCAECGKELREGEDLPVMMLDERPYCRAHFVEEMKRRRKEE